jgi:cytochrome c oxidase cbb3-type subunit 3
MKRYFSKRLILMAATSLSAMSLWAADEAPAQAAEVAASGGTFSGMLGYVFAGIVGAVVGASVFSLFKVYQFLYKKSGAADNAEAHAAALSPTFLMGLFGLFAAFLVFIIYGSTKIVDLASESKNPHLFGNLYMFMLLGLTLLVVIAVGATLINVYSKMPHVEGAEQPRSLWQGMMQQLTDATPIAKEADVMMDHDYDGIRELDNNLPPWWLWGFYLCVAWSIAYMIYYHVGTDWSTNNDYYAEMAKAEKIKAANMAKGNNSVDENTVVMLTDATAIANGKATYTSLCTGCHGPEGQGLTGNAAPNLTDEYWIYGGGIKNVFKSVKYGYPEKGMIPWKSQLSPAKIQEVASYVWSLQGTKPANAKEPQGEIWSEAATAAAPDSTATLSPDSAATK